MKKLLLKSSVLLLFLFFAIESQASHLMGGQITYNYVSGTTYQVTLTIYRDCDGIGLGSTETLNIAGPVNSSVALSRITINDVTTLCPGQVSTCNGGTVPGIEEHIYQGNITVPTAGMYILSYNSCCRNGVITTGAANDNFYLSAQLNTSLAPGNSSPDFLNKPVGRYCTGSPVSVGPNGSDPDGDVIVYSLVPARGTATSSVNYNPPFSGTNPLTSSTGVSINPNTGEISFTPTANEIPVLAFIAEEYRVINGNSVKIGEIYRDIQLELGVCSGNTPPVLSAVPNAIVQVGQNYCVNINATDAATQSISLSAVGSIIPPATFNVTSSGLGFTNSTFCFTPQASDAGNTYTVSVNAQDDFCPSSATAVRTWNITVPAVCNVSISSSQTGETCAGNDGTATANLVGGTPGYSYSWTGPNGYTSFSGPTITGLEAGTYTVNISDANNCAESATIVVADNCSAGCDYTFNIDPRLAWSAYAPTNTFVSTSGHMYLYLSPSAGKPNGYTYAWDPNPYMSADWGYVIRAYPTAPTWFKVTITRKSDNCVIRDSVFIDYMDIMCGNMLYNVCNTSSNTTTCAVGWNATNSLLLTGNYALGACVPKADFASVNDGLSVFPNPSSGALNISMPITNASRGSINVLDMNGRVLYAESVQLNEGLFEHYLNVSEFANGVYSIQLISDSEIFTQRVVIQH